MNPFEQYMLFHEIDPVRLSMEAHVRYLTVYNAKKGFPVLPENAQKIKDAVLRLTGVPYVGSFVLMDQNNEQPPSLRMKQLPKNHYQ